MNFFKKLSLVPKGLRYQLTVAFSLMSIIPLLVAAYLVRDYIFPPAPKMIEISCVLFFSLVITILGLVLARQMIEPVIDMALEAKLIAEGDLNHKISVSTEDEIGDIGRSINKLTMHIKENMEELTSYGEKTRIINTEIHKKVLVLSSLLQIGENISAAIDLEEIMSLIAEKIVQIMDTGYAALFMTKADKPNVLVLSVENNLVNDKLRGLQIAPGEGFIGSRVSKGLTVYIDSKTKFAKDMEAFRQSYGIKNFAAFPIISKNRLVGTIVIGNEVADFVFSEDNLDLLKVFAKQAAIALEKENLAKKARELAIQDDLTGLFNEKYITLRLEEEIKRGVLYQRPCSYVIFNIDNFNRFREENGELATEKALKKIACVINENVSQIGRAARLAGDEFSLLLPEKNKRKAYIIAEEVRKRVENLDMELGKKANLTISGGVSENPIDGSTAEDLKKKAYGSLAIAKSQGKNRIV